MPTVRSIFLSDIHLGTRACQAERLLDFLRDYVAQNVFLIGDIVDFWAMRRGISWSAAQNTFVQKMLKRARHGERVVFIPGNHDEIMRRYLGAHFGGVEVVEKAELVTADGRRLLVTHGDQFDAVVVNAKWLAHAGDRAYDFALWLNTWFNRARRLWGGQYWSLSNWA